MANGLPEEGEVEVFYDPENPGESVLKTGDYHLSWGGFWGGCMFAGFAAVWMTMWWGMSNWLPDKLGGISKKKNLAEESGLNKSEEGI